MKNIVFATGSRADYGIMRRFLRLVDGDKEMRLSLLVTGALLDDRFGHQVELIHQDGFHVDAEIKIPINTASDLEIIHAMAVAQDQFAIYFSEHAVDLLLILGDRYEMLSVAVAAAMQKIPILHIHGGEATFGNYDEFIRHAITKMSIYHFTATEEYRKRVIQLGEAPERVFCLGALGAENCMYIKEENVPDIIKELPEKKYFVILFHPETLTNVDMRVQMQELLVAIGSMQEYGFIFLGTNADTHSDVIREYIKKFVRRNQNAIYFENLHTDAYHYLLKNAVCLLGNSSSGLIEAPSLGIYTINIGDRQKGRVRGNSIIDVKCNASEISAVMKKVLEICRTVKPENPYYRVNSARLYYETLKNLVSRLEYDTREPKYFYNLS